MCAFRHREETIAESPFTFYLFVQLPGKIVGILKSSNNRDNVEVLVSMAKFADAPSQAHPGKKTKVVSTRSPSPTLHDGSCNASL